MVDCGWWIERVFLREVYFCRCFGYYCGYGKNNFKKIISLFKNNGCWGRLSIEDIRRFVIYGIVFFGICYREILIWFRYFIFN